MCVSSSFLTFDAVNHPAFTIMFLILGVMIEGIDTVHQILTYSANRDKGCLLAVAVPYVEGGKYGLTETLSFFGKIKKFIMNCLSSLIPITRGITRGGGRDSYVERKDTIKADIVLSTTITIKVLLSQLKDTFDNLAVISYVDPESQKEETFILDKKQKEVMLKDLEVFYNKSLFPCDEYLIILSFAYKKTTNDITFVLLSPQVGGGDNDPRGIQLPTAHDENADGVYQYDFFLSIFYPTSYKKIVGLSGISRMNTIQFRSGKALLYNPLKTLTVRQTPSLCQKGPQRKNDPTKDIIDAFNAVPYEFKDIFAKDENLIATVPKEIQCTWSAFNQKGTNANVKIETELSSEKQTDETIRSEDRESPLVITSHSRHIRGDSDDSDEDSD